MYMRFCVMPAALAACMLPTPASAQDRPLTYFCDRTGFIRSDQTGAQITAADRVTLIPCPEAVLLGQTRNMTFQYPGQAPFVVVVKPYLVYRGWGLDSHEWRTYWRDLGSRIYYSRYQRQRGFNDGYRTAVRDLGAQRPRPDYADRQHPYRSRYGTWNGGRGRYDRDNDRRGDNRGRGIDNDRAVGQNYYGGRGNGRRDDRNVTVSVRQQFRQDGSGEVRRYERRHFRDQSSARSYRWSDSYRNRPQRTERSRPYRSRPPRRR